MQNSIWYALLTIVLLPLLYLFLKRKLFPEVSDSIQQNQQAKEDSTLEVRGDWKGTYGDVWRFTGKLIITAQHVKGHFHWTFVDCPNNSNFKDWKKRKGQSGYEFVSGNFRQNILSLSGYEAQPDIEFIRLSDYTIILNDNGAIEGTSTTRTSVNKESGQLHGFRV